MAKKKTRVQEPRGPGPKESIPRVAEPKKKPWAMSIPRVAVPKKKPWAMSIERAQVKPLRELPPGTIRKHVTPVGHIPPETVERVTIRPPKKVEPSTIVNIKQPIAGRRKGKPVPPPLHTPLKPAPRRSPTLKWRKKSR